MKNVRITSLAYATCYMMLVLGFSYTNVNTKFNFLYLVLALLSLLAVGMSWALLFNSHSTLLEFSIQTIIFAICIPIFAIYLLVKMGLPYSPRAISWTLAGLYFLPASAIFLRERTNHVKSHA